MDTTWYVGFLPWVLFATLMRTGGTGLSWAAFSALVLALGALALARRLDRVTTVERVAPVLFGLLLLAGSGPDSVEAALFRSGRVVSALVLAAACLWSASHTPFTLVHLRDLVTPHKAASPEFMAFSRRLARRVALASVVLAGSHAVAAAMNTAAGASLFNWLVPLAVLAVAGVSVRTSLLDELDEGQEPEAIDSLALDLTLAVPDLRLDVADSAADGAPPRV